MICDFGSRSSILFAKTGMEVSSYKCVHISGVDRTELLVLLRTGGHEQFSIVSLSK